VPKPIKLLEGIGNGETVHRYGAQRYCEQHFILLWSIGVYGQLSPVVHLRIYILCQCRRSPLYRPMLILACLTGV